MQLLRHTLGRGARPARRARGQKAVRLRGWRSLVGASRPPVPIPAYRIPAPRARIPDTGPLASAPRNCGGEPPPPRQARRSRFPVSYRPESQNFLRSLRSRKIGQNFLRSLRSRASLWTRFGVCASRRPQARLVRLPLEIFILGPSSKSAENTQIWQ